MRRVTRFPASLECQVAVSAEASLPNVSLDQFLCAYNQSSVWARSGRSLVLFFLLPLLTLNHFDGSRFRTAVGNPRL